MERDFETVCKEIIEVAPEILAYKLERDSGFWAPEIRWIRLTNYVNDYVIPSSKDPRSIKVYAILCDCSEGEMKETFENDGI